VTARSRTGKPTPPPLDGLVPVPTFRDSPATPVADLSGTDLDGGPVHLAVSGVGRWTLLLFLSTGCQGCLDFWAALDDPGGSGLVGDELAVAVTRDPDCEDVAALRGLATGGVPLVMSSSAWDDYRVQGPPFFVLVDGTGESRPGKRVATEGVAWSVAQVSADVRRARGTG
jgi:hypothetical protein